ncbi:MAG TPA: CBS domain-containing protein [Gemmatimonadaceae bacterium]|jgi:CBS domain-containing protein|nr:CBS domain-containing protein [Gemmatimonadaceae bacterium]
MRLTELLRADRVVIPLEQRSLSAAIWTLVERLGATGVIDDPELLRARIAEGRGEDLVVQSGRAFIAHYRTETAQELGVAIGVAPEAIARDVDDGDTRDQSARVLVVLLAPPRMAGRYLQALGAFSRVLSRSAVVDQILAAHTGQDVLVLRMLHEVELAPQLSVREIMTESPRSTRASTLLRDAAREMVRSGIGALPVIEDDGLLVGMLSERELMRHMLSLASINGSIPRPQSGVERARRTVRDVMTRQVLCVSPDQPLAEVASLMTNKDVDRVPVVEEGRLVGFLTRSDIVRKLIGS